MRLSQATDDTILIAAGLDGLAALTAQHSSHGEDIRSAASFWGAATAVREHLDIKLPHLEQMRNEHYQAAVRDVVDPAVCTEAWQRGRELALEDVVAIALKRFDDNHR